MERAPVEACMRNIASTLRDSMIERDATARKINYHRDVTSVFHARVSRRSHSMMRLFRKYRVVGIACLLIGNLACAGEQTRLAYLERGGGGLLFFPYPATVSLHGVPPVRRVHPHLLFDQYFDALNLSVTASRVASYGPGLGQADSKYLPASSPSVPSGVSASRDDFASQDDEWHFSANPQLGANHEHEKGVTFSVRHGF
jgi:hypothetical protein